MLPLFNAAVYHTRNQGVPYFTEPGVALIATQVVDLSGATSFLDGFGPEVGFGDYLDDPDPLFPAEKLVKFAGQVCYLSLGPGRTRNKDAPKYLTHIKESGHGSVLEHASFSFLFWGISRSVTHELVRHRAGWAFSQVSQRYVDGAKLRFVERPEYQADPELHTRFELNIEAAADQYNWRAERLLERLAPTFPSDLSKTERRKRVNQAARAALPNETEAPIVATANVRAWRHFLEMRCAGPAEVEIRRLAYRVYRCLTAVSDLLFDDYREVTLPDGTLAVATPYRKV